MRPLKVLSQTGQAVNLTPQRGRERDGSTSMSGIPTHHGRLDTHLRRQGLWKLFKTHLIFRKAEFGSTTHSLHSCVCKEVGIVALFVRCEGEGNLSSTLLSLICSRTKRGGWNSREQGQVWAV